ncbi:MAG: acetylglutamate kinase [Clostridiaceae bacterium]
MFKEEHLVSFDALPYIKKFAGETFVIKYGGSIIESVNAAKAFYEDVAVMRQAGIKIIIVHGGGPLISSWLKKTGNDSKFINGLRVTDSNVMDVVEMVLSGHVNKEISCGLSLQGVSALGVSGRDCNLIIAKKKYALIDGIETDIGFVGEVVSINKDFLSNLVENGIVPVISPVGGDYSGNKYNINADYVVSFISSSLKVDKFIILTDVPGVYKDFKDSSTLIRELSTDDIKELINDGTISGGMIPKMECCVEAIEKGVKNVHLIDGRKEHSLLNEVISNKCTRIYGKRGYEDDKR